MAMTPWGNRGHKYIFLPWSVLVTHDPTVYLAQKVVFSVC